MKEKGTLFTATGGENWGSHYVNQRCQIEIDHSLDRASLSLGD